MAFHNAHWQLLNARHPDTACRWKKSNKPDVAKVLTGYKFSRRKFTNGKLQQ